MVKKSKKLEQNPPLKEGNNTERDSYLYASPTPCTTPRAFPSSQGVFQIEFKQKTTVLLAWGARGWSVGLPECWKQGEKSDPRKERSMKWGGPPYLCINSPSVLADPWIWTRQDSKDRKGENSWRVKRDFSNCPSQWCRDIWGPARGRDLENTLGFTLKPQKDHIRGLKDSP